MGVRIYIGRHGQDEDNAIDILNGRRNQPLTVIGRKQAQQLAEGIVNARLQFDAVYVSPLIRASETADIVAKYTGFSKPIVINNLIERDFGVMTGKNVSDIEKICAPDIIKTSIVTYFLNPEGAETFPQLVTRGQKVLDEVRARHSSGKVLLICHGDIGKMIYAAATGKNWKGVLVNFHLGNCELIDVTSTGKVHLVEQKQYNH